METMDIDKAKKLVPKLRFKGFDEKWEKVELNAFASINPKNPELPNSFIYIDLESVTDGVLLKEDRIFKVDSPSRAQRMLEKNDILYQTVRPYQKNNLYFDKTGEYVASTGYAQIRTVNDSKFLFQFLHTEKLVQNVMLRSTGTSYPSINSSDLSKIKISFPSLPEQQKIASFLSAVDEKIQQLTRKKELLEQYKKGVMQQLFSGKLRFKDDTSTELNARNGKSFPDWEEKKLGEVGETYNGLTGKTKEDFGNGKPYVQYKQIFDNSKIDISRFELVNIGVDERQKKVMFGDVFFTVSSESPNEIGTASVLLDAIDELYLNSFCFGYRVNSLELLSPYFSRYLFRSELFRNEIVKLAQGSTRYNMSKVQLMKLIIQLPCLEEQQKIANFLSSIDAKIECSSQQITQTQTFKKGLLQKMFV